MRIVEVQNKMTRRGFLEVPRILYRNDPNWVCPLDQEIEGIFDPGKNSTFRKGEATRWILSDTKGNLVGRIAAFIDRNRAREYTYPIGGIGFFECINDSDAASLLFSTARQWLENRGMQGMDGPVNFGENNNNWGLLVHGFTQPGYGMPYHLPYYRDLFEKFGFRNYYEQYSYHLDIKNITTFPERFMKIADWVSKKPGYRVEHASMKNAEKYVNDMVSIYNSTWASLKEDFTPVSPKEIYDNLRSAKPIIDEELLWFAYHNETPIAFFFLFPDINQILKHLNGRLTPLALLRFFYYKQIHTMTRMRAFIAGILPKYQNMGIETVIFKHLFEVFRRKRYYTELELSWVGEYNPKMRSMYEALGAIHAKTHVTYRFLFDRNKVFRRYVDEIGYMNVGQKHTKES